jgi:aminopeptidase N
VPARSQPDPERPRYELRLQIDPAASLVSGELKVRFTPDVATDRLVFRLWPNGPRLASGGARLDAGPVTVDRREPVEGERPDPTTLVVPLGRSMAAGETVTASMPWRLQLPGAVSDRIAHIGDTVRLGSFFPILGWEPGFGWTTDPPTTNNAETSTAPTADFDMDVSVPAGIQVFATGEETSPGHWRAIAVRDVNVVVGRFRVAVGESAGIHVTVAVEGGVRDDPRSYLTAVVRAIDDLTRRYGPYPWPAYTLVITPTLTGGIEYPMVVSQGPGTQGRSTPHEVAHQWFYALVGNNQGRDPWLDEGLATFAEARVLGNLSSFVAREVPADARGRTGAPMTYWNGRSSYYRGVYVQGAQALAALGNADAVDCALRIYVAQQAFGVARVGDLAKALELVFPDARAVLARYGVNY